MKSKQTRTAALLLAAALLTGVAAGCKKEEPPPEETSSSSSSEYERLKPSDWKNPLEPPELEPTYTVEVPKENREKMLETKKSAPDVVAYLQVPGTSIDDVVVQYSGDDLAYAKANGEYYYERKDIYGNYKWEGCFFMDFEDKIGSGTPEDMPQNTIIYAHHLGNPQGVANDPNGQMFAPLLFFREKEFAEKTPYIYLTTEGADLVYQVFAAGDMPGIVSPVEYNLASYPDDKFNTLIEDMRSRSYFLYPDIEVTPQDKMLALSTCIYDYGTYRQNHNQRFVVFAKLITDNRFVETATVEENPNRKIPVF